eukprot:evm.model.scf_1508.1 EVM.evm.TU.scf_1508.1   scf_1508:2905-12724(+)
MHASHAWLRLWLLTALVAGCAASRAGRRAAGEGIDALGLVVGGSGKYEKSMEWPSQMVSRGLLQEVVQPISADEALLQAAERGDQVDASAALTQGADLEARGTGGRTPLITASSRGFVPLVTDLLAAGALVDAKADDGTTALLAATKEGHRELVQLLMDSSADLEAQDNEGTTPIIAAARNGRGIILLMCLAEGANPNSQDLLGETAIFSVSAYPNTTFLVENIIDRGGDPNHLSVNLSTPMHSAAFYGSLPNAEVLVSKGGDKTLADSQGRVPGDVICGCRTSGRTPGALPCPFGHCQGGEEETGLEALLVLPPGLVTTQDPRIAATPTTVPGVQQRAAGGPPVARSAPGGPAPRAARSPAVGGPRGPAAEPPLSAEASQESLNEAASQEGHLEVVRTLIAGGAEVNSRSLSNSTPLMKAAEGGHLLVVRELLEAGAEPDGCCTRDEGTALIVAAEMGLFKVVVELLDKGADPSAVTAGGQTALFKASAHLGTSAMLGALLDAGAPLDHRDNANDTALGYAAFFGNRENVKFLLGAGADPGVQNSEGQVARKLTCGCLENEGVDEFLGCPSGACDNAKNRKKIAKLLKKAEGEEE